MLMAFSALALSATATRLHLMRWVPSDLRAQFTTALAADLADNCRRHDEADLTAAAKVHSSTRSTAARSIMLLVN